jgi:thymidylate synthase (FAD)
MRVVNAGFEIMTPLDGKSILKHIERCGRVCYKSEEKITEDSCAKFVSNIIKRGHESVLEHFSFSVRFIVDRGISHEIVRHRIASYSQESTRYCNYGGEDVAFINPKALYYFVGSGERYLWEEACELAEKTYKDLIENGSDPQQARSVLPNSLKTEVVMTANLREWRHFLRLRTASAAHSQMREVTVPLLDELRKLIPVIFDDIVN